MTTAERLKRYRWQKRMTQEALAAAAGLCGASAVSMIERGRRRVTAATARKLASAMGMKQWWRLLEEDGNGHRAVDQDGRRPGGGDAGE